MSYFAGPDELERELVAFLNAFFESEDGARAAAAARARGDGPTLVLRTVDPETVVSVDFAPSVSPGAAEHADVEIRIEADALHDILLERLDPVQISRLYETDRLTFSGAAEDLAALIVLARTIQPHYPASLARRGRDDLLGTPAPPTKIAWGSPDEAQDPKRVIGRRRTWQRPRRTAEA